MSFQIRSLMIKLAPDETERRITVLSTDHCMPQTACCACQTSQEKYEPCEGAASRREGPNKPSDPEANEAPPELDLLQQQLRQTLSQSV